MPWWSWVVIWVGLVALLIGVLAIGAIWLFRKARAAFHELDRLELVQQEAARLAEEAVSLREHEALAARQPIAFGRHSDEVREHHEQQRELRRARALERREERVARGRALTHADPMQYAHLIHHPKKG